MSTPPELLPSATVLKPMTFTMAVHRAKLGAEILRKATKQPIAILELLQLVEGAWAVDMLRPGQGRLITDTKLVGVIVPIPEYRDRVQATLVQLRASAEPWTPSNPTAYASLATCIKDQFLAMGGKPEVLCARQQEWLDDAEVAVVCTLSPDCGCNGCKPLLGLVVDDAFIHV